MGLFGKVFGCVCSQTQTQTQQQQPQKKPSIFERADDAFASASQIRHERKLQRIREQNTFNINVR